MNGAHHCEELLGNISDYVDGSLRQSLCQELEKHLADCPNCRVVVNTLKKTIELYQQPDEGLVPPSVKNRLFFRLSLADFNFPAPTSAQAGELCPNCAEAVLDYDEMLNLRCGACGWSEAGCST